MALIPSLFSDPLFGDPFEPTFGWSLLAPSQMTPRHRQAAQAQAQKQRQQQQQLQQYGPASMDIDRAFVDFDRMLRQPVSMDVNENEKEFLLTVRHPGLDKKNLNIELNDRVLTISGKHTEEKSSKNDGTTGAEHKKGDSSTRAAASVAADSNDSKTNNSKANTNKNEYYSYRSQSFQRTMTLPETVDVQHIQAKHDGEALVIKLPKLPQHQNNRKQILIE